MSDNKSYTSQSRKHSHHTSRTRRTSYKWRNTLTCCCHWHSNERRLLAEKSLSESSSTIDTGLGEHDSSAAFKVRSLRNGRVGSTKRMDRVEDGENTRRNTWTVCKYGVSIYHQRRIKGKKRAQFESTCFPMFSFTLAVCAPRCQQSRYRSWRCCRTECRLLVRQFYTQWLSDE